MQLGTTFKPTKLIVNDSISLCYETHKIKPSKLFVNKSNKLMVITFMAMGTTECVCVCVSIVERYTADTIYSFAKGNVCCMVGTLTKKNNN